MEPLHAASKQDKKTRPDGISGIGAGIDAKTHFTMAAFPFITTPAMMAPA